MYQKLGPEHKVRHDTLPLEQDGLRAQQNQLGGALTITQSLKYLNHHCHVEKVIKPLAISASPFELTGLTMHLYKKQDYKNMVNFTWSNAVYISVFHFSFHHF